MVASQLTVQREAREARSGSAPATWSFITNYALVLIYVVQHPESTVRAIAQAIGITERATLAILRDLDNEQIVERHRSGRRNTYAINFRRLSSGRRGGTTTQLTPRPFVDRVIQMLFELYPQDESPHDVEPPRVVPPANLQPRTGTWGFFTNHMLLLLAMARDGSKTVRELAMAADITERAAVAIINQLEAEGVVVRHREGRRNRYTVDADAFRDFRGWTFDGWRVPRQLIDVAATSIRGLAKA